MRQATPPVVWIIIGVVCWSCAAVVMRMCGHDITLCLAGGWMGAILGASVAVGTAARITNGKRYRGQRASYPLAPRRKFHAIGGEATSADHSSSYAPTWTTPYRPPNPASSSVGRPAVASVAPLNAPRVSPCVAGRARPLYATFGTLNCRPVGIGSAAPTTRVTNSDLEGVVETNDEWISTRTGIGSRHVLTQDGGVGISDLATAASRQAIEMAGVSPEDIDIIIVATSSPDDLFGDATTVQRNIGAKNAVAFDITAACSGFLFSSVTAGQYLHVGGLQTALVVGSDALSRWVDWDDRNSCILFGDGAGAMVLKASDEDHPAPGLLGYAMHSDGGGHDELELGYKGEPRVVATPGDGTTMSSGGYKTIGMNGKEVYRFATREVPVVITEALEAANLDISQVDWLLLHQANIRIMETVAKKLGVDMSKVITNLKEYGNTSAASIPLALDEAVRSGVVKKGDTIACAGFGAGLSWGAAIFKWDP